MHKTEDFAIADFHLLSRKIEIQRIKFLAAEKGLSVACYHLSDDQLKYRQVDLNRFTFYITAKLRDRGPNIGLSTIIGAENALKFLNAYEAAS